MRGSIKVHVAGIKTALSSRLAYRFDLIISMITMSITEITPAVMTLLIYNNSNGFPGWTCEQVLLLQGTFMLAKGIAFPLFFGLVWKTIISVRDGTFDLFLLKPRSVLHMIIVHSFDTEDIGKFFVGAIVFGYAAAHVQVVSYLRWVEFSMLFLVALGVLFACAMIMSGIAIRFVKSWRLYEIMGSIWDLGMYPSAIKYPAVNFFITFAVPVLAIAYIPSSVLLDVGVPHWQYTLFGSAVFITLAYGFWQWCLKSYTSAGG